MLGPFCGCPYNKSLIISGLYYMNSHDFGKLPSVCCTVPQERRAYAARVGFLGRQVSYSHYHGQQGIVRVDIGLHVGTTMGPTGVLLDVGAAGADKLRHLCRGSRLIKTGVHCQSCGAACLELKACAPSLGPCHFVLALVGFEVWVPGSYMV